MYKSFYGLKRNPFEISPDPHFYCPTPQHNEALACLHYGIHRKKGFVVVTGEVGTGKTLLLQCLFRWLSTHQVAFSHVFHTRLSSIEFLQYVLSDFGLPIHGKNKTELLIQLNHYLINRHRQGATTALIIDEGHLLDWEVLEEVRLLTNLETVQQKLLQIILVGQPELDDKMDSADLRQLKQRISLRCRLKPLAEEELRGYVQRRLELAGSSFDGNALFSEDAFAAIAHYSTGIPRLINTICENALITGFARQQKLISREIIEQVAEDFRLSTTSGTKKPRPVETSVEEMLRVMHLSQPAREAGPKLAVQGGRGTKE